MTPLARLGCAATALVLAAAPSALAQEAPPSGRTVTSAGTGQVKVRKPATLNDQTIRRAVAAAHASAVPKAVAAAQAEAQLLAAGASLTLGALQGVAEQPPTPFAPFSYGELGTFGPGRYCGTITRVTFHRTQSGRRVPGRRRRVHTCRVPARVSVNVTATYAAS